MNKRLTLLVLSLLFCVIPTLAQNESPWGDGQVIVYASDRNGNNDLFMMTLDGSYEIQLTYDTSNDTFPAFNPQGGSTIAFQSDRSGSWQIYTLSLISGEIRQITEDGNNYYPDWATDGQRLVFSHLGESDAYYQLFTIDLSMEVPEVRQLTATSASTYLPDWSPDGTQILMTASDGDGELWLVNAETGEIDQRLTDNDIWDTDPEWSPDGRFIVHTSGEFGSDEIYVFEPASERSYRLTDNSTNEIDPAWSRDGKYIVFVSDHDGQDELYMMTRNGSNVQRLTHNTARESAPTTGILGYQILAEIFLP